MSFYSETAVCQPQRDASSSAERILNFSPTRMDANCLTWTQHCIKKCKNKIIVECNSMLASV